jgi:hypothetical protein
MNYYDMIPEKMFKLTHMKKLFIYMSNYIWSKIERTSTGVGDVHEGQ